MSLRRGWLQPSHTRKQTWPAQADGDDIVIITENQLDEWVRGNAMDAQGVIARRPEVDHQRRVQFALSFMPIRKV